MSDILLDTHSLLWFAQAPDRLSQAALDSILQPDIGRFVSVASVWEVAIKIGIGKLHLDMPLQRLIDIELPRQGFTLLEITGADAMLAGTLPPHHRDPFDRMLVAQALGRKLPVVSADGILDLYQVSRIW